VLDGLVDDEPGASWVPLGPVFDWLAGGEAGAFWFPLGRGTGVLLGV